MIKKLNLKALRFLSTKSYPVQLLLFLLAGYATMIALIPIAAVLEMSGAVQQLIEPPNPSNLEELPLAVIIAPIIETLIFQHLVFLIFRKWIHIKNKYGWAILVSSILFGLGHMYNVIYIIFAFLQGLTLAYCYYFYKRNIVKAFWSTAIVHAIHNGMVVLVAVNFPDI